MWVTIPWERLAEQGKVPLQTSSPHSSDQLSHMLGILSEATDSPTHCKLAAFSTAWCPSPSSGTFAFVANTSQASSFLPPCNALGDCWWCAHDPNFSDHVTGGRGVATKIVSFEVKTKHLSSDKPRIRELQYFKWSDSASRPKLKPFFLPWLHIGIMNRQRCIFFNLLSFVGMFSTCVTSHMYKIIHIQMTIDEILNFYYTEHGQTTFQTVGMVRKWKRIPCNSDQLFSQPKLTRLSARTGHSKIQMYL